MKRPLIGTAAFAAVVLIAGFAPAASAAPHSVAQSGGFPHSSGYDEPFCTSHSSLCVDSYANPGDEYVGQIGRAHV